MGGHDKKSTAERYEIIRYDSNFTRMNKEKGINGIPELAIPSLQTAIKKNGLKNYLRSNRQNINSLK